MKFILCRKCNSRVPETFEQCPECNRRTPRGWVTQRLKIMSVLLAALALVLMIILLRQGK